MSIRQIETLKEGPSRPSECSRVYISGTQLVSPQREPSTSVLFQPAKGINFNFVSILDKTRFPCYHFKFMALWACL